MFKTISKMYHNTKSYLLGGIAAVGATVVSSSSANAALADLFTAVDVTGVSTNVQTLMIAFIGINILFLGYAYVKKTMNRA